VRHPSPSITAPKIFTKDLQPQKTPATRKTYALSQNLERGLAVVAARGVQKRKENKGQKSTKKQQQTGDPPRLDQVYQLRRKYLGVGPNNQ
jgi:hypothetical protein